MEPSSGIIELENGLLKIAGTAFDHYTVVREIGRGANGVVFEVVNRLLNRREALKVWLTLRVGDTRDKIEQGIQEARKASIAAPAHAVTVYHANILAGFFYATMEYVDGLTLKTLLHAPKNSRGYELSYSEALAYRVNYAGAYIDALARHLNRVCSTEIHIGATLSWFLAMRVYPLSRTQLRN
jgi:serine/threonine protein kinase